MKKSLAAANPDAYMSSLRGWQRTRAEALRSTVCESATLVETVKWGHLVYFSNGPLLLIRAEKTRILFGFWRGQRLQALEKRLKSGGKYEMATLELREDTKISAAMVRRLTKDAVALNKVLGDPTRVTAPSRAPTAT